MTTIRYHLLAGRGGHRLDAQVPALRTRGWRFAAAVLLLAAAAAYAAWTLEFVLPTGLSPVRSFVSEHYPVFQPYQVFFRGADVIAGTACLAAAGCLLRLAWRGLSGMALCGGIAVLGLATIADAVFVPECSATVDSVCERRELSGQVPWHHPLHLGSSVLAQAAVVVVAVAVHRLAAGRGGPAATWTVRLTAAVWAIGGLGCLVSYPLGWAGVAQRVQLLTVAAGTVAGAAWLLWPHPRHAHRADRETSVGGAERGIGDGA